MAGFQWGLCNVTDNDKVNFISAHWSSSLHHCIRCLGRSAVEGWNPAMAQIWQNCSGNYCFLVSFSQNQLFNDFLHFKFLVLDDGFAGFSTLCDQLSVRHPSAKADIMHAKAIALLLSVKLKVSHSLISSISFSNPLHAAVERCRGTSWVLVDCWWSCWGL